MVIRYWESNHRPALERLSSPEVIDELVDALGEDCEEMLDEEVMYWVSYWFASVKGILKFDQM